MLLKMVNRIVCVCARNIQRYIVAYSVFHVWCVQSDYETDRNISYQNRGVK